MINLNLVGKRWYQFDKPIDPRLEKAISKKLSYVKAGSQFMAHPEWGVVKLYNSKKRAFPSGLLFLVKPILVAWHKKFKEDWDISNQINFEALPVQLTELRGYQIEAFEAFKEKSRFSSGSQIVISVAGGKTKLGERILASCGPYPKQLVVAPTKEVVTQWKEELEGQIDVHKQIKNPLVVTTYQKLYSDLKKDKTCLDKYDFVIFDEIHRIAANTFYKVGLACKNATIIGLTGTPKRSDGADLKIQAITGPIIYIASIEELTKKGFLTPVKVNIVNIPKFRVKPDMDYRDIYNAGIINNVDRNTEIIKIAFKTFQEGPLLILFDNIAHGEFLRKELIAKGLNPAYIDGSTKDRDTILKDIKKGKYDLILASRVYNEGINIPQLKTLILASAGKSPVRIIQQIGRVIRLHESKDIAEVYDFADSCRTLGKHFKERLNIYYDNGFEVKYL